MDEFTKKIGTNDKTEKLKKYSPGNQKEGYIYLLILDYSIIEILAMDKKFYQANQSKVWNRQ